MLLRWEPGTRDRGLQMALPNLALGFPALGCWSCRNDGSIGKPGIGQVFCCNGAAMLSASGSAGRRVLKGLVPAATGLSSVNREALHREKLKVESSMADGQNQSCVEIPVTCYQVLCIPEEAEKDEIFKSMMELKGSEIDDGHTADIIMSRQNVLMDVRDKLLFEPEYAGNIRENIPPKSTLRIPWAWLPGVLCLLQEVGEEKKVLEIGRAALQHQDVKPFTHDLLLSMALAECSIAKAGFEKNKVYQGFDALARAHYILRSKASFENIPLLSQIEESLEEFAPTCTLEILSMPCISANVERRAGAVAALRELLRQGLEEASCKVQDWPTFLNQALKKLTASEVVDLLPWDDIAITRKNKKSLESQSQRTVIGFDCFFLAMIAHLALGFSRRQTDLINKAKMICECLEASESVDLKLEEGICSVLLGEDIKSTTFEKLHHLEINGKPISNSRTMANKEVKSSDEIHQSLEGFLKDAVLDVFPDTQGCSPSLANFFRGQRRISTSNKPIEHRKTTSKMGLRSASFGLSHDNSSSKEVTNMKSSHLGEAVKQLASANLQSQLTDVKSSICSNTQLKRELGIQQRNFLETWWNMGDFMKIAQASVVSCIAFSTILLLLLRFGQNGITNKAKTTYPKMKLGSAVCSMSASDSSRGSAFIDKKNVIKRLGELLVIMRKQFKTPSDAKTLENNWFANECSKYTSFGDVVHKRQMPLEEAESLLKQWQTVKAEALDPNHQMILSEVPAEPMLSQWQELADTAKAKSCFWRFVLLQIHVLRADIIQDGVDEKAEIEAILEEAAELIDGSQPQPKNPNYYSTYTMRYILKREFDGSWKFCSGDIQTPA